ncbi:MAG: hypothetical protein ACE5FN_08800 [Leptospirillia bacterium]
MFNEAVNSWEYRIEHLSQVQVANQLNFMGKDGWELITVFHKEDAEYPYECFLKRPRTISGSGGY